MPFLAGVPGPEGVYNEITQPVAHSGYLHRSMAHPRLPGAKKSRDGKYGECGKMGSVSESVGFPLQYHLLLHLTDFQRVWCSLERALLIFETEKCTEPLSHIQSGDLLSLGVSRAQPISSPGPTERYLQDVPVLVWVDLQAWRAQGHAGGRDGYHSVFGVWTHAEHPWVKGGSSPDRWIHPLQVSLHP